MFEQIVPDGWRLVPVKLTPEMRAVIKDAAPKWNAESIYASLLDLAPTPPTSSASKASPC